MQAPSCLAHLALASTCSNYVTQALLSHITDTLSHHSITLTPTVCHYIKHSDYFYFSQQTLFSSYHLVTLYSLSLSVMTSNTQPLLFLASNTSFLPLKTQSLTGSLFIQTIYWYIHHTHSYFSQQTLLPLHQPLSHSLAPYSFIRSVIIWNTQPLLFHATDTFNQKLISLLATLSSSIQTQLLTGSFSPFELLSLIYKKRDVVMEYQDERLYTQAI